MTVHPYTRLFAGKTVPPTINDDVTLGYEVGDIWIDEVGGVNYQAVDVTDGAAVWQSPAAGSVSSVNGQTGAVVLDAGDIGSTPVGNIYADNVQAALEELDAEKAALASAIMDGDTAGGDLAGTYPDPEVAKASKSFLLPGEITAATGGGTVDDWNPTGLADASVIYLSGGGTITGIVGGAEGRILILHNSNQPNVTLLGTGGSSAEANQFAFPFDIILPETGGAVLRYTHSRWRPIAFGQFDVAAFINARAEISIDDADFLAFVYDDDGPKLAKISWLNFRGELVSDAEGDPAAIAKTAADGTSTYLAHRDHVHTAEASNVTLPVVGTPDFNDVQDAHTIHGSAGIIDGDATFITKVDETHIDVAAGQGLLRTANDVNGDLVFVEWAASAGIVIPAGTSTVDVVRYVGVEYNAGSPQITVRTTFNWNWQTDFPLGRVTQDGTTLRVINVLSHSEDTANLTRRFLRLNMPYTREEAPEGSGGLEVGDLATRYLTMTAGNIWHGFNRFALAALDTSGAARFDAHYRNAGGGFTHVTSQQQWPNTQYDDGSGTLADMTTNRYGCLWVYVDVSDGSLDVLYGTSNAVGAANAQLESPPASIPGHLTAHGKLLGRIVYQKSASTATLVESAWSTAFHGVADIPASEILAKLVTVDGSGSGLDADLLDGLSSAAFSLADTRFGDGSNGDVTISVDTTLTSDMYYHDLTINNAVTLFTAGFVVYVSGTLVNNGTISAAGGAGGNGGTGNGAGGTAGVASYTVARNVLGLPTAGGTGEGTSATNTTNGAGGTAGASELTAGFSPRRMRAGGGGAGGGAHGTSDAAVKNSSSPIAGARGGAGGTATGTGNSARRGGGGGAGGGCIELWVSTINNAGTITANGGDGGNGATSTDASGNGGGGGGGDIMIYYHATTGSGLGTRTVAGGNAGTGGAGGAAGSNGYSATMQI